MKFMLSVALTALLVGASGSQPTTTRGSPPPPQIVTGIRGSASQKPKIFVSDFRGEATWTWTAADAQKLPADLTKCMDYRSATEAKWTNGGHTIAAIYGDAALLITYSPGTKQDKTVVYGICLDAKGMDNAHSVELLSDNLLAIANDNAYTTQSINIYNISANANAYPDPLQQFDNIPAVHALVWDAKDSLLWAAGTDAPTSGSTPARSILNAYKYSGSAFNTTPLFSYEIAPPQNLSTEFGPSYNKYWAGPHDMIGVPNDRKFIITTDIDMHLFDLVTGKVQHGQAVADQYFPGFAPVDVRTGQDGVSLPRSDLKSLSLHESGMSLYTQAPWQYTFPDHVNILRDGKKDPDLYVNQALYKSRWFSETPGWPAAKL